MHLAAWCSLIPVAAGIYFFKKLNTGRKRILYFFVLAAYADLSNAWMASNKIHNIWQENIYSLFEFSFFIIVLKSWIKGSTALFLCIISSGLFYAIWLVSVISVHGLGSSITAADITKDVIIMSWSVYLVGTYSIYTEKILYKNYKTWFAGTAFVYFSMDIMLDYLSGLIAKYSSVYKPSLWNVHSVFQIIIYLSFAYVFYLKDE